jgi:hypothetical protein
MNIIYTLSIILLTLFINASVSFAMPYLKIKYKALITTIKRKSNTSKPIDCVILEIRVNELEKKLAKRQENQRTAIRQEIKNILLELKNK